MHNRESLIQEKSQLVDVLAKQVIDGLTPTMNTPISNEWKEGLWVGILHTLLYLEQSKNDAA